MGSYISITQLKEFADCPHRFYLKRIKRVKEKQINSSLILGSAVHEAAELIAQNDKRPEEKDFKKLYDNKLKEYQEKDCLIDYGDWSSYEDEIRDGTEMVQTYYNIHWEGSLEIVANEVSGLVSIPGFSKPLYVGIDFLIDGPNGFVLGDIKTGKSGPTQHFLRNDLQLNAYVYGLKHGKSIVSYSNLSENKKTSKFFGKKIDSVCILNLRDKVSKKKPWHSTDLWYWEELDPKQDDSIYIENIIKVWKALDLAKEHDLWYKHTGATTNSPCQMCPYRIQGDCK